MTWLRVDIDFPGHESIGYLAERLRIDPDRAGMTIMRIWCGFGQYQPDGLASAITDTTLEDWAKWRGPRGKLAAAVREKLVDEDGRLKGWWRQEALLRHQEKKRARRKTGIKPAPVSRPISADNGNGNDNGTTYNQSGDEPIVARLERRVGEHPYRATLLALLHEVPPDRPKGSWAGLMLGCLEGTALPGGMAATIEELAAACTEYPGIRNCAWAPAQFLATVNRTVRRLRRPDPQSGEVTGEDAFDRAVKKLAAEEAAGTL